MQKRKYDEIGPDLISQHHRSVKRENYKNHGSSSNNTPLGSRNPTAQPGSQNPGKRTKIELLLGALEDVLHESSQNEFLDIAGPDAVAQASELRKTLQARHLKSQPSSDVEKISLRAPKASYQSNPPNIPKSLSPLSLTPWVASEIPQTLPALPQILDPTLEESVFIHRALAHQVHNLSYERLEWVGDAYIQLMSTLIISQTFPAFMPGENSHVRQLLVKNSTLADYAHQYGLPPRIKLPPDLQKASDKDKLKIWGDVFEAYVAAVILSDPQNGVDRCAAWLKSLWSMTIAKEIRKEEAKGPKLITPMWTLMGGTQPIDQKALPKAQLNPKERLAQTIGSRGIKITYREAAPEKKDPKTKLPLFTIGVYLDGWGETDRQLGFGRGHGKKEAGFKAAEQALSNKKLMTVYMEKKKLFDAQLLLEQEAEEKQKAL